LTRETTGEQRNRSPDAPNAGRHALGTRWLIFTAVAGVGRRSYMALTQSGNLTAVVSKVAGSQSLLAHDQLEDQYLRSWGRLVAMVADTPAGCHGTKTLSDA